MTPIVWSVDILSGNPAVQERARLVEINPLYHFLEIVRAPLLGQHIAWFSWAVVGVITVVGWTIGLLCMRNYRARVAYWV
jgi:ABC-2 type transport system permease protein